MKKIYSTPITTSWVVNVTAHVLTASENPQGDVTISDEKTSDFDARKFTPWADEEAEGEY